MRRFWIPGALVVIGVVLFAVGFAGGFTSIFGMFKDQSPTWAVPGEQTMALDSGKWVLYERTGTATGSSTSPLPTDTTISADRVTVVGPQGEVPASCLNCGTSSTTLSNGSSVYTGVVAFEAVQDGNYTVRVAADETDGTRATVVVGPSIGEGILSSFLWLGVAGLGVMVGVSGLLWAVIVGVIMIVDSTRSSQPVPAAGWAPPATAPEAPAPGPPPAGWYPDPIGTAGLRWWDGQAWTDQTAGTGR